MALQNQLDSLEQRISLLVTRLQELAAENSALRDREQLLSAECARLAHKHAAASLQIETVLSLLQQHLARSESATTSEEV